MEHVGHLKNNHVSYIGMIPYVSNFGTINFVENVLHIISQH